ncbi:30S ribosomal protein S9 [Desulfosudis oleivorans]|uniref:Small ribosomal subunit protein uS9 n=1 Tax=Desulfosudis oleivorans (strain DSM 6200 / JCM 39069 / Hxd3) TaxID=96561 RepID=RS9_DESOH|nr:30S ribosomal protein S9 [Desulfosudis oleivorans]A8ZWE7.1 RecName: Full=Small ribosomal subunit protein uS9; AltName: Full=30S ribosomal protein S9 [Desulfosudis oleivorans Hxd3]ABW66755.1 ribosomal protein S9 [Desulfosudis oleivorans Hxd3]
MEAQTLYATGKRKTAIARTWMKPGSGKITVNGKDADAHFTTNAARIIMRESLKITETLESYDVDIRVIGGGITGQAGAARHGISKILAGLDPEMRQKLKANGFLTRDARVKERKKYGQRGARARYQFSKR